MFSQSAPQQQGDGFDFRFGINVFYWLISGFATCFTVFLRRTFGGEAFGINALASILIMVFYMSAHPESGGMVDFFGLWWIALFCQRVGYFIRRCRRISVHSRFEGISWLAVTFPFLRRSNLAGFLEVPLCFVLGAALAHHDQALGRFVAFGSVGLLLKGLIDSSMERKQVQRMQDAAIDQRSRLERWRNGNY